MKHLALLLTIANSISRALADPSYVEANGTCTTTSKIGKGIFCCNGACHDGTTIFDKTGLCGSFDIFCGDAGNPGCSKNQVFYNAGYTNYDPGLGDCYLPAIHDCQWQQNKWSWQCCDCPPGYVSVQDDCANEGVQGEYNCFGCTSHDETVQYNDQAGVYICNGPGFEKTACNMLKANENLLGWVGLASNLLGGLCPTSLDLKTSSVVEDATLLFSDIYSIASAIANPTSGIAGSELGAASAVVGTISSIAIGIGLAVGGVDIGGIYGLACGAAAGLSFALTLTGVYSDHDLACQAKAFRRDELQIAESRGETSHVERATSQPKSNSCTSFLSYFAGNYSILSDLDSACDDIYSYTTADSLVAGVANTTAALQQACNQLRDGQNATLFDLPGLLTAIENFVPYCDDPTKSEISSSSAATLKSSHSLSSSRTTSLTKSSSLAKTTSTRSATQTTSHKTSSSTKSSSRSSFRSSSHSSTTSISKTSTRPTSHTSTTSTPSHSSSRSSTFHSSTKSTSHASTKPTTPKSS